MIEVGFKLIGSHTRTKITPSNLTPGLYAKLPIYAEACSKCFLRQVKDFMV